MAGAGVWPFDSPASMRSLRATLHGRGGTARPEAQPASLSRMACHERGPVGRALPVRLRSHGELRRDSLRLRMACPAVAHLRKGASRKVSEGWRKRLGVEPAANTYSKGLTVFSNSADPQISILCRGEPPNCPQRKTRLTGFLIEDRSMAPCGVPDWLLVVYDLQAVAARRRVSDGSSPKQSR